MQHNGNIKHKRFITVGLICGFGLGFLYGVGGFIYDYTYTGINNGSYLALSALWAMPLLFGGIGFIVGWIVNFLSNKKGRKT